MQSLTFSTFNNSQLVSTSSMDYQAVNDAGDYLMYILGSSTVQHKHDLKAREQRPIFDYRHQLLPSYMQLAEAHLRHHRTTTIIIRLFHQTTCTFRSSSRSFMQKSTCTRA
ncbi:hypothetical protein MKX03_017332 [Papaver bracteatum]|nr:hypothetical protein MKX03_017332 [Papaver bracteatum]